MSQLKPIAVALSIFAGVAILSPHANAQTTQPPKPAAAKKKDATPAYAAGTKAFESGKMKTAIKHLSKALSIGGLPGPQMAKALYYRGVAYRKTKKPAQAISDLTTAVWLKGGLSDSDRAKATEDRRAAYREAGLGDNPPPIGASPLDAPATIASAAGQPVIAQSTSNKTIATAPAQQSFWSSLFGGSSTPAKSPPPAAAPAPAQTVAGTQAPPTDALSWQTATIEEGAAPVPSSFAAAPPPPAAQPASGFATTVKSAAAPAPQPTGPLASIGTAPPAPAPFAAPAPVATPAAAPAPAAPAPAAQQPASAPGPVASAGSAITGFFSNMFSSGTGAPAAAPAAPSAAPPLATATTATSSSAPKWAETTVVAAAPAKTTTDAAPLPWTANQSAALAQPPAPAAPSPAARAAPKPAPPRAAAPIAKPRAGKYRLQVAAVRSRAEAERMAASLRSYQALYNGAVRPEIDEAVIGSMGTFYRVRLGPYANAKEPGDLCKTLKPQGFDCLVVTQ
jgi:SPOR domain